MADFDNPESLVDRGEAMRLERRPEEALSLFRKAVAISPGFVKAHHGMVLSLQSLGRTDQALSACKEGLRYHPNDKTLHELIVDLLIWSRPAEALEYLCTLLAQYPQDDRIWFRFGWAVSSVPIKVSSLTRPWLLKALNHPVTSAENIAHSIWKGLLHEGPVSELIALSEADNPGGGGQI
jgi:tetratricopeptide (TPR) repeat protein